jgi:hypothetical protein
MIKIKTSKQAIEIINEKTNLSLVLPESKTFSKIKTKAGVKFFSVMLETQPSESIIFKGLQQFAKNCSFIKSIEEGGAIMATIILK